MNRLNTILQDALEEMDREIAAENAKVQLLEMERGDIASLLKKRLGDTSCFVFFDDNPEELFKPLVAYPENIQAPAKNNNDELNIKHDLDWWFYVKEGA